MDDVSARPDLASAPARRRRTLITATLLVVAVLVIAAIVFSPAPPDAEGQRRLAAWLAQAHRTWLPRWITFGVVEFASNVVMFLPLGFLGALVFPHARRLVLAACALFSTCVELTQWLALPARQGDWRDVLANTLGAAIGLAIAALVTRAPAPGVGHGVSPRPRLSGDDRRSM